MKSGTAAEKKVTADIEALGGWQPGCRHRAVGKMKIVNVSIHAFDPEDEWFD